MRRKRIRSAWRDREGLHSENLGRRREYYQPQGEGAQQVIMSPRLQSLSGEIGEMEGLDRLFHWKKEESTVPERSEKIQSNPIVASRVMASWGKGEKSLQGKSKKKGSWCPWPR